MRNNNFWRMTPVAAVLAAFAVTAQADAGSPFTFSGFATVGVTGTNTDDAH